MEISGGCVCVCLDLYPPDIIWLGKTIYIYIYMKVCTGSMSRNCKTNDRNQRWSDKWRDNLYAWIVRFVAVVNSFQTDLYI